MSGNKYFAASNTENGFFSYFGEIFRKRSDCCYIIKGGPGTGKSRLMREMGAAWENAGGEVEYYYCSSDPDSLDGLFVRLGCRKIAVLDGTAPHSEDIENVGVVDNIIDLGRFWDSGVLRERKAEISAYTQEKKQAYQSAYRALSSYASATRLVDEISKAFIDVEAIEEEAARIAVNLKSEELLRAPTSAVGMKGFASFETLRESAGLTLSISDIRGYGASYLYLDALLRAIGACRVAPHPILLGRYCGILSGGVAIVEAGTADIGETVIDMADFVDRSLFLPYKERIDRIRSAADNMLADALISFAQAGEAHKRLEGAFASAMNFDEKEAYSSYLCSKIASGDL